MTGDRPLVSIGMPLYNAERTLEAALTSLLAQGYENIEIIICDNGSSDSTQEMCAGFVKRDRRISYYRNPVNQGAGFNFRRALELSSGEYFMWAGCHDLWEPDYVCRLVNTLEANHDVVLAYTETCRIDEQSNICNMESYHLDTRGLSRSKRVMRIVSTLEACDMFYGLYRAAALRQCRNQFDFLGADHVLLMEISILGEIAEISGRGFLRRQPIRDDDESKRVATILLRLNPDAAKRKNVRRWWELGRQHMLSIWLAPIDTAEKMILAGRVGFAYFVRFRQRLFREIFHPLFPEGVASEMDIPNW